MSSPPAAEQAGALEPVRGALLRSARADAEALLDEARKAAEAVLGDARAKAEALLDQARRQGEADGRAVGAAERLKARRTARAHDLAARSEAYLQLRRQVTERVREVGRSPQYAQVRDRLVDRARHLLGPDASIGEASGGGVVASVPGRRVDFSLDALAARALDRLGAEVQQLWAP